MFDCNQAWLFVLTCPGPGFRWTSSVLETEQDEVTFSLATIFRAVCAGGPERVLPRCPPATTHLPSRWCFTVQGGCDGQAVVRVSQG